MIFYYKLWQFVCMNLSFLWQCEYFHSFKPIDSNEFKETVIIEANT